MAADGLLRVGDPLDKNTDVGAINSAAQLARIDALVAAGEEEGAHRRTVACALPDRGYWFAPTLFTDVSPAHRIAVEEIFGPVVSVLSFRTEAEAIEKANDSRYGLAAGIWTDKGAKAFAVAGALRAGGLAEHLQPLRSDRRVRRIQGIGVRARGRAGRAAAVPAGDPVTDRLAVRKTYKLWIGGAFVRSESGRYDTAGVDGHINIPRASRKDVRDAVTAARAAAGPWAARTAYNRGQILYRAAEALESRRRRRPMGRKRRRLEAAVDVLVHHAGWTDKFQPVLGGINPVAAPFLSFSVPEPTGVVGIVAPDEPDLLGLVAELGPALAAGNTVVAVLSETRPLAGLDLAEVLGVADIPAGVVNLLCGRRAELATRSAPIATSTRSSTRPGTPSLSAELARLGAETIKRVRRRPAATSYDEAVADALGGSRR